MYSPARIIFPACCGWDSRLHTPRRRGYSPAPVVTLMHTNAGNPEMVSLLEREQFHLSARAVEMYSSRLAKSCGASPCSRPSGMSD